MSDSIYALSYHTPVQLPLAWVGPTARLLGGGVLFAAVLFVMVALPGLID